MGVRSFAPIHSFSGKHTDKMHMEIYGFYDAKHGKGSEK